MGGMGMPGAMWDSLSVSIGRCCAEFRPLAEKNLGLLARRVHQGEAATLAGSLESATPLYRSVL